jgi:hypothetical protein
MFKFFNFFEKNIKSKEKQRSKEKHIVHRVRRDVFFRNGNRSKSQQNKHQNSQNFKVNRDSSSQLIDFFAILLSDKDRIF